ncbi:MAG: hypothetical protein NT041_01535, partial [Candidatus Vogelbacteria bacterium]|nr:hypothetical protein [Candidatus Vogelbacteria bacterium]
KLDGWELKALWQVVDCLGRVKGVFLSKEDASKLGTSLEPEEVLALVKGGRVHILGEEMELSQ